MQKFNSPCRRARVRTKVFHVLVVSIGVGAMATLSGATCLPGNDGGEDAGVAPEPEPSEPTPPVDAGPPDTEGPRVAFVLPEDRCLSSSVTFEFTAIDDGVGTGFVSAVFAGVAVDLVEGESDVYAATIDTSGLFVGLKDLVVTAIDLSNNITEARHTYAVIDGDEFIEHTEFTCGTPPDPPPDDVDPPTVAVISPIAGFDVYESATFAMTIRATDDVGPVTVRARVGTNEIVLDAAGDDQFSGVLPLTGVPEGAATVVITATDLAARTAETTRAIFVDRTPPIVVITEPQAGAEREWLNDVVAQVTDNIGVDRVTLFEQGVAQDLGSATTPRSGTTDQFGIIHDLDCAGLPRDLTFVVEGQDRAGNIGQDTVDVTIRFNPQCN